MDTYGTNLFGIKQQANPGAGEETINFAGAYSLKENTSMIIELKADTVGLPVLSKVTVALVRDSLKIYDFSRGDVLTGFFSSQFPTNTVEAR